MTYYYSYKPRRGVYRRLKAKNLDLVLLTVLMLLIMYVVALKEMANIIGGWK